MCWVDFLIGYQPIDIVRLLSTDLDSLTIRQRVILGIRDQSYDGEMNVFTYCLMTGKSAFSAVAEFRRYQESQF